MKCRLHHNLAAQVHPLRPGWMQMLSCNTLHAQFTLVVFDNHCKSITSGRITGCRSCLLFVLPQVHLKVSVYVCLSVPLPDHVPVHSEGI